MRCARRASGLLLYEPKDVARFGDVLTALQLVDDDYLGGQGSRGSGKVVLMTSP